MIYKYGFDGNDYGALVEENGVFVNRGMGAYMKTPRTVPKYGYLDGERKSIFNCYHAYVGADRMFGTWVLINGTHVDIVRDGQFESSFDADEKLATLTEDEFVISRPSSKSPDYQIYLTRLTDSKKTDRFYMGLQLFHGDKLYKNCRIIFGLGINPNGVFELEKNLKRRNCDIPLEHVKHSSMYGFTNSELRELEEWFK